MYRQLFQSTYGNHQLMKIAVVGTGYVGVSLAVLLAQNHEVIALDIVPVKIDMLNNKKSPVVDSDIEHFLANIRLDLTATLNKQKAYLNAEFVIVATPTDYDAFTDAFNTQSVEIVIQDILSINPKATIIIKSTVPVGYTASIRKIMLYFFSRVYFTAVCRNFVFGKSVCMYYLAVASARTSLKTVTLISPGKVISSSTRFAMSRAILWAVASSAFSALRMTRTSLPA